MIKIDEDDIQFDGRDQKMFRYNGVRFNCKFFEELKCWVISWLICFESEVGVCKIQWYANGNETVGEILIYLINSPLVRKFAFEQRHEN